jgi:phosphatidylglycerophosphate synthase
MEKRDTIIRWVITHASVMLISAIAGMILRSFFPLVMAFVVSLLIYITQQRATWSSLQPVGGAANLVTFGRCAILIMTLLMQPQMHHFVFTALITLVIIADGIDGYLARKMDQSTQFGEIFDTEVDAFLALSVSFLIWKDQPSAWWLMVAGVFRYAFGIAYYLFGWHQRVRPPMPESKAIAVIYFLSLLSAFFVDWKYACWIVLTGCLLVGYSFGKEFVLLSGVSKNA